MSKDEFAAYLTERGFPAENNGGVVEIRKERPLTKKELKEVKGHVKEAGYRGSYGYILCAQKS